MPPFKAACTLLWGPQYRSEAARQLGVSLSTANRWDRGDTPVSQEAWRKLAKLMVERQEKLAKVLAKLPLGD